LNMSLYVQCGQEPKIETICKGRPSRIDITYEETDLFSQERDVFSNEKNISGFIASKDGQVISSNTAFSVSTAGGAEYLQAIDVCLDHAFKHSKTLVEKLAMVDVENDTDIIPTQVDHLITSNSINVSDEASVTPSTVHIDPRYDKANHRKNDLVKTADLNDLKNVKYAQMTVRNSVDGFIFNNPPFGSDFRVVATEERKLGGFSNDLKPLIDTRNQKVKKHVVESRLKQGNHKGYVCYNADRANNKLSKLYENLLDECKTGFLETLFNTQSYQLKIQAKNIIKKSMYISNELMDDPAYFIDHIDDSLNMLKVKLSHLNDGVVNDFKHQLVTKIDNSTDRIIKYKNAI
jgi:hypothetical protein